MRITFRFLLLSLLVLLLGLLTGCSVFGIATKGDLDQQVETLSGSLAAQKQVTDNRLERAATEQQALDDQLAYVAGQMEAMNAELGLAMADLEIRNAATAAELVDMQVHFELIQGQLQLALADLESVAGAASRAEAGSRQAVQLHQDAVLSERDRLQVRLQELDTRINAWYPPLVPAEELSRQLQPEVSVVIPVQSAGSLAAHDESPSSPGLQVPRAADKDKQP